MCKLCAVAWACNSRLLFSHIGAWWRKKDSFQSAGSVFHTYTPDLRVEERTACAGGEWVIEGGGSSPVDSMRVNAQQRGRWRPGDPSSATHHSLRAHAAPSAAVPWQEALDDAAVIAARSFDDILKKSWKSPAVPGPSWPVVWCSPSKWGPHWCALLTQAVAADEVSSPFSCTTIISLDLLVLRMRPFPSCSRPSHHQWRVQSVWYHSVLRL